MNNKSILLNYLIWKDQSLLIEFEIMNFPTISVPHIKKFGEFIMLQKAILRAHIQTLKSRVHHALKLVCAQMLSV